MSAAKKDDRLYLIHIVEALRKILRYTRGGREAFLADEMIQDAVYRNFLVIGEAAKHGRRNRCRVPPYTELSVRDTRSEPCERTSRKAQDLSHPHR